MQVKSIAGCSKGSILQYFRPSLWLPFVIKIFVLSILSGCFTKDLLCNSLEALCDFVKILRSPLWAAYSVASIRNYGQHNEDGVFIDYSYLVIFALWSFA